MSNITSYGDALVNGQIFVPILSLCSSIFFDVEEAAVNNTKSKV